MRRATCSERVTEALPVTMFTSGSVISGGGEGHHVGMVSGCVGREVLGGVGGVVGGGVCIM